MWHGPALSELLSDVTAEAAAAHPIPGAHSIWELVEHVRAWTEIVRARLAGTANREPSTGEDWPPPPAPTMEHWRAAIDRLREGHRLLAGDVAALEDAALDAPVAGRSYTVWAMLHGVVEHGTYHGGQIALLKRASAALPRNG